MIQYLSLIIFANMIRSKNCIFIFSLFISCLLTSCISKHTANNEYRDSKVRVSERQLAQDKKVMRKAKKSYQKQMRKNRKLLFGRARAPKAQYFTFLKKIFHFSNYNKLILNRLAQTNESYQLCILLLDFRLIFKKKYISFEILTSSFRTF